MASKLAGTPWAEILHHAADDILELRWLPTTLSELCLNLGDDGLREAAYRGG